jgi:hypothetical protein
MDSGGFTSTRSDPVFHYHSVYDTERFQEIYADPGFVKHVCAGSGILRHTTQIFVPGCCRKELGFSDAPSCQCAGSTLQYNPLCL